MDAPLTQNRLNNVTRNISVIPLNFQDHLILYRGEVVGMYHKGFKVARIHIDADADEACVWLQECGYRIDSTIDTLGLCEWIDVVYKSCEEIISKQPNTNIEPPPFDLVKEGRAKPKRHQKGKTS